jgi:hypothetical protein
MDISKLRQTLIFLDKERRLLQKQLILPHKLIGDSVYNMYKKCGKPDCYCNEGKKHGPYLCISINRNNKRKLIFVRKKDEVEVKHKNWKYKQYKKKIKRIEEINNKVVEILNELKEAYEEDYEKKKEV